MFVCHRRYSRSPRRDRRRDRYSRSRSRSRDRRADVKSDKNSADKSNAGTKKTTMAITGKKLPFIGRMPVFKKQTGKSNNTFLNEKTKGL